MLSVIVCTYNREKYIYNQLKSIAENSFPTQSYEIVLINNKSTDNTENELKRFQADFPEHRLRYFIENQQGLSYARNRGIAESKGDILVYVDDDAKVNKVYLETYALFFEQNPAAMAAGGPILPIYETEAPTWFSYYTEMLITGKLYCGKKEKEFKKGAFPGGGNAAYRKDLFEKTGSFNTDLGRKGGSLVGSEEKDIFDKMTALKMKIYYLPTAILYHLIPAAKLTKEYFTKLTYEMGRGERLRTQEISKKKYYERLFMELIKWGGSFVLCLFYCLKFQAPKGFKLLSFRWNLSKGLLNLPISLQKLIDPTDEQIKKEKK